MGFPGGSDSKKSACNVGDLGLLPGLGNVASQTCDMVWWEGRMALRFSGPEFIPYVIHDVKCEGRGVCVCVRVCVCVYLSKYRF